VFRVVDIPRSENGYHNFQSQVLDSQEQFDAFVYLVGMQGGWNDRARFLKTLRDAKTDFAKESLVLVRHTEGSDSVRVSLDGLALWNVTLTCVIRREIPVMLTDMLACYCFAVAVEKGKVKQVESLWKVTQTEAKPREVLPITGT